MSTAGTLVTADELLRMPDAKMYELQRGQLIEMAPAGGRGGHVTSKIDRRVGNYVEQKGLGWVLTANPGFFLERDPDTVRVPDVAFVSYDRLPQGGAQRFHRRGARPGGGGRIPKRHGG